MTTDATSRVKALWKQARPRVRDLASELLRVARITEPARFASDKLSIVTFHRVLPEPLLAEYPIPGIAMTPGELDYLLAVFQEHYTPGPLREVAARYDAGERPRKPLLAVTFDDGQRDNLSYAQPVLVSRGVRASFFVVTEAVEHNITLWHDRIAFALARLARGDSSLARPGARFDSSLARPGARFDHGLPREAQALLGELRVSPDAEDVPNAAVAAAKLLTPEERTSWLAKLERLAGGQARPSWDGMMSWQELRVLQAAGHEIGSHSTSHPILPLVSEAELTAEIAGSRRVIAEQLGGEISSFCYPNGDHDERVVAAVQRAGYRYAVTTRYGINACGARPFTLKRFDMQGRYARTAGGNFGSAGLLLRLTGQLPGMA